MRLTIEVYKAVSVVQKFLLLTAAGLLTACGGGSEESSTPPVEETVKQDARYCFDETLFQREGNTWAITSEPVKDNVGLGKDRELFYSVESTKATFANATELTSVRANQYFYEPRPYLSGETVYLKPDGPGRLANYGSVIETGLSPFKQTDEKTYTPPYLDDRGDLKVGGSTALQMIGSAKTAFQGSSIENTSNFNVTSTVVYSGDEMIATPLGTFKACKFIVDGKPEWIWHGFEVQSASSDGIVNRWATALKLNGQAVSP